MPTAKFRLNMRVGLFIALLPFPTRGQLNVAVDFGTFRYNPAQTYAEIYYSIPTPDLKFVRSEAGRLQAQVMIRLTILKDGSSWREDAWRMEKTVDDSSQIHAAGRMVDQVRYVMAPGKYQMSFHVEDLHDAQNSQKIDKELTVVDFSKPRLKLSDVQFACAIKQIAGDSSNVFYKNGLEVIPEPGAMYGQGAPLLHYYLEAYNLVEAIAGHAYKTRCQITDAGGEPLAAVKPREQTKQKMAASVEVGALNVSVLPSGAYQFWFCILDAEDKPLQTIAKKFYVYNPGVKIPEPAGAATEPGTVYRSEFATMSEKELNADFDMARYIARQEEKKAYASLKNPDGKRQYLFEFWQRQDPTPGTPGNEFRVEYQRRLQHTNDNFRSYTRPGWKTDRGRVYILYGPPNDVERFPNNPLSYSYEIWHYDNIEGGVIFVFADLQEFGEYVQLHSTKRGEPMNADWEKRIQKN
ncbi:GWxTD domain-containing protein [candidate division KSB1 bacterium]|nr:GWxTD domain-containing protein [candidate division KSB1 bacterium]